MTAAKHGNTTHFYLQGMTGAAGHPGMKGDMGMPGRRVSDINIH